jgi:hypothetical protein
LWNHVIPHSEKLQQSAFGGWSQYSSCVFFFLCVPSIKITSFHRDVSSAKFYLILGKTQRPGKKEMETFWDSPLKFQSLRDNPVLLILRL